VAVCPNVFSMLVAAGKVNEGANQLWFIFHVPCRSPIPWVSPNVFYLASAHTPSQNPLTLTLGGLHLLLEGRGQVAVSGGVDGPERKGKGYHALRMRVVNNLITFDHVLLHFFEPRAMLQEW